MAFLTKTEDRRNAFQGFLGLAMVGFCVAMIKILATYEASEMPIQTGYFASTFFFAMMTFLNWLFGKEQFQGNGEKLIIWSAWVFWGSTVLIETLVLAELYDGRYTNGIEFCGPSFWSPLAAIFGFYAALNLVVEKNSFRTVISAVVGRFRQISMHDVMQDIQAMRARRKLTAGSKGGPTPNSIPAQPKAAPPKPAPVASFEEKRAEIVADTKPDMKALRKKRRTISRPAEPAAPAKPKQPKKPAPTPNAAKMFAGLKGATFDDVGQLAEDTASAMTKDPNRAANFKKVEFANANFTGDVVSSKDIFDLANAPWVWEDNSEKIRSAITACIEAGMK